MSRKIILSYPSPNSGSDPGSDPGSNPGSKFRYPHLMGAEAKKVCLPFS